MDLVKVVITVVIAVAALLTLDFYVVQGGPSSDAPLEQTVRSDGTPVAPNTVPEESERDDEDPPPGD